MAAGRCAGCGRIDSLRKISTHIVDCTAYLNLFQHNPLRCLTPAAEYERHRAEDTTPVARAEQRGTRLAARFAELNRQQLASVVRWQRPPDILE
jgi:hypothetical protein